MSYFHLLDLLTIVLIAIIWALLPSDLTSVVVHWVMKKIRLLAVELPYSRNLEMEADEIGLQFAAKVIIHYLAEKPSCCARFSLGKQPE